MGPFLELVNVYSPTQAGSRRRRSLAAGAGAALWLATSPAFALQTLSDFMASAKTRSLDNREAALVAEQRSAEVDLAWGKVLPALTARGAYTRNQYESKLPPTFGGATLTPLNQLDATFTVDVPLIDIAGWSRVAAAKATAEAADARSLGTTQETQRAIAQRYYQLVAADALVESAARALSSAEAGYNIAVARKNAGAGTDLDIDRAQVEIERARQNGADAELLRAVSRKALESLSGLAPSGGGAPLDDNLVEEAPLETWGGADVSPLPLVRAAELDKKAADRTSTAAKAALVPVIAATATERLSNAAGFGGHKANWTAGLTATWRIDYATVGGIKAGGAGADVAAVREDKAKLTARDRIHDAWQQVHASIAKSRAARAQVKASVHAAALAKDRYVNGAGTQLDLIQAERDSFAAEVQRIQADGDLLYARIALRLGAGRPVDRVSGSAEPAFNGSAPATTPPGAPGGPPAPAAPAPTPPAPAPRTPPTGGPP